MPPYVRVETNLVRHDKFQAIAGKDRPEAVALFVGILGYCGELLTDGEFTKSVAVGIGEELGLEDGRKRGNRTLSVLKLLISRGLIDPISVTKMTVHNYVEYQKTREQVLASREKERAKKRQQRQEGSQISLDVPLNVPQGTKGSVPQGNPQGTKGGTRARARAGADLDLNLEEKPLDVDVGTNGAEPREPAGLSLHDQMKKAALTTVTVSKLEQLHSDPEAFVAHYATRMPPDILAEGLAEIVADEKERDRLMAKAAEIREGAKA